MKPTTLVTILFLTVIAVGHLLRALFAVPLTVASRPVPMWMSVAACLFAAALAVMLWRGPGREMMRPIVRPVGTSGDRRACCGSRLPAGRGQCLIRPPSPFFSWSSTVFRMARSAAAPMSIDTDGDASPPVMVAGRTTRDPSWA